MSFHECEVLFKQDFAYWNDEQNTIFAEFRQVDSLDEYLNILSHLWFGIRNPPLNIESARGISNPNIFPLSHVTAGITLLKQSPEYKLFFRLTNVHWSALQIVIFKEHKKTRLIFGLMGELQRCVNKKNKEI